MNEGNPRITHIYENIYIGINYYYRKKKRWHLI